MYSLGIDIGATSTKWALGVDGELVKSGVARPIAEHVLQPRGASGVLSICEEIKSQVSNVDRVVAGITGVFGHLAHQQKLTESIAKIFVISTEQVQIYSDIHLLYLAQFRKSDGILIYSGTGSVVCYREREDVLKLVGGRGYLVGDEGGGFWIGATAIRKLLRGMDEGTIDTILEEYLLGSLLIPDFSLLSEVIYGASGRSLISSAALGVMKAAVAGSETAQEILKEATEELIRLFRIAIRSAKSSTVALCGGILSPGSVVRISCE
jgi:glucosamine kinase